MAIQSIESVTAGGDFLEFRYEPQLMYGLVLGRNGAEYFLGGDQVLIILERLLAFLTDTSASEAAPHGDGLLWKWILTTGPPHHFVFGRKHDGGAVIKFRDPVALRDVGEIKLTPGEVARWTKQLSDWRLQVERLGDTAFV